MNLIPLWAGSAVQQSVAIQVVAPPNPVAIVTPWDPVMTGHANLSARVTSQPGCTYQWTIQGGTLTSLSNQPAITFTAGQPGTLTLQCAVTNQAQTVKTVTKDITVGQVLTSTLGCYREVADNNTRLLLCRSGQAVIGAWYLAGEGKYVLTGTLEGYHLTGTLTAGGSTTYPVDAQISPDGKTLKGIRKSNDFTATLNPDEAGVFILPAYPAPMRTQTTLPFTTHVAGTYTGAVAWTVPTGAGSVSDNVYTAPDVAGEYTLTASILEGTRTDQVTVTVKRPVVIAPSKTTVKAESTQAFTATLFGFTNEAVTWRVMEAGGGEVSSTGLYTAPATAGTYTLRVTSVEDPSLYAEAKVTVPFEMSVTPSYMTLATGQSLDFKATVSGAVDKSVTWTLEPALGSISAEGRYQAPATLTTQGTGMTIKATSHADSNKWATAYVVLNNVVYVTPKTVTVAAEASTTFSATLTGVSNTAVTWSCTGGSIDATGRYTAPVAAGQYTVRATSVEMPSAYSEATVIVSFTVTLEPISMHLSLGAPPQTLIAKVLGGTNKAVTWRLDGPGTLTQDGVYTVPATIANQGESATVYATSVADPTKSASCAIHLNYPVYVTPNNATVQPGATQPYTATVTGQATSKVVWTCTGGTIDANGLYTAPQDGGHYKVRATLEGDPSKYYEVDVFVAMSIKISPQDAVIMGGFSTSFQARVLGHSNQKVTWSVETANGGTITPLGVYTPPGQSGTYTIKAVSEADPSVFATTTIKIAQAVMVTPEYVKLKPGAKHSFKAKVSGSDNQAVTWYAPSGAITAEGVFTAPTTEGKVQITATAVAHPAVGRANVEVTNAAPVSVTVTPGEVNVAKGGTVNFTAAVFGAANTSVKWTAIEGTIDEVTGAYTAPNKYGTFTVKATSIEDNTSYGTAVVIVENQGVTETQFTYDANGNMLSDGERTFEWDDENRLLAVNILATGHRSEFAYDGIGRRVVIRELDKDNNGNLQVTSDKKYLWEGTEIVQERDTTGGIVAKQFYPQGFIDADSTKLFYTRDHLGSIRELVDNDENLRTRYDYDPYGKMMKVTGDKDSPFTYTGHFWHGQSWLNLTLFRAYDPNLGRWISRDPIEEKGGNNLYRYCDNSPTNGIDQLGLWPSPYALYKCVRDCYKMYDEMPPANPGEPNPNPPNKPPCDGQENDEALERYNRAKAQQKDRIKAGIPLALDCLKSCWSMVQPFGAYKPDKVPTSYGASPTNPGMNTN